MGVNVRNYVLFGVKTHIAPREYLETEKGQVGVIDSDDYIYIGKVIAISSDARYDGEASFDEPIVIGETDFHTLGPDVRQEIYNKFTMCVSPEELQYHIFTRYT